jgi:thiol-disulfide isomerase/thioredoxin
MADMQLVMILTTLFLVVVLHSSAKAGDAHEYRKMEWTALDSIDIPSLEFRKNDNTLVSLSDLLGDKLPPITIISFMAEWCKNCRYEAPFMNEIYTKFKDSGLELIIIMEYSTPEGASEFLKKYEFQMPVLFGELSLKDEARKNTTHHSKIRNAIKDPRKWGTPFHIVLDNVNSKRVGLIPGEMERDEIREFLEKKLNH